MRILFALLVLLPLGSEARAYLYESTFYSLGSNYADLLADFPTDNINNLPADQREACNQRYGGILNDGLLDIRIAIGYFDWTVGHEVSSGGQNYGLSPSLDIGAYYALRDIITENCSGNLRLCRFRQEDGNPYAFTRDLVIQGRKIRARIQMNFASMSEYYSDNVRSSNQATRSSAMESYFVQALQNADAVFYFGHSRDGGGPDFRPPVLIPGKNKVNYDGYYEVQRPGFKRMVNALSAGRQTAIIGLMSCDSRDHFLRQLRSLAPRTGVITSTAVVNVDQVYTAMIGGIDALLRGQCQKSFYKELRMTSKNSQDITMDGMFE